MALWIAYGFACVLLLGILYAALEIMWTLWAVRDGLIAVLQLLGSVDERVRELQEEGCATSKDVGELRRRLAPEDRTSSGPF